MKKNYKEILNQIKAFVFDMDGVLTNGQFQISSDGLPIRNLNSKDGYAIQLAIKKGYTVAIISGGHCEGVKSILQNLGLTDIYMRASHKLDAWNDLLAVYEHQNLKEENMLYMGDDIPDYHLIERAGLGCAPHNAVPEIRAIADYVSPFKGGGTCVRDVIEQTLKVQDNWMLEEDFTW
jgi:3-deoxy-D-manno-octulosonate 8-phosphate phosphatase (KDO 8-P phosphatase)